MSATSKKIKKFLIARSQGQLAECRDLTSKEYEQFVTDHDSLPVSNGTENIGNISAEELAQTVFSTSY